MSKKSDKARAADVEKSASLTPPDLDPERTRILKDIEAFSRIKRYQGMLPGRLGLYYREDKLAELLNQGLVERITASFPCGAEETLFRLTEHGLELASILPDDSAEGVPGPIPPPERLPGSDLTKEQRDILSDLYHYSKIRRHNGIAPHDLLEQYEARDANVLFAKGYLIRVKAEMGSGKKRKGLILSDLGLRFMKLRD